ncbi:hypothetical protein L210DRAFT_861811, partial [Boletus edulis BED1]
PKASDYDPKTCLILNTTIYLYHVLLLTDNSFPEAHVELEYAKEAWDMSSKYHKSTDITLDAGLVSLITTRSSNLRGEFKSKAQAIVTTAYGFELSDATAVKENNRERVTELKSKSELHPCRAGIYQHKAIQQIINEVLFKNKGDEGIKWMEYYNPFPRVGFALMLMAIECAIDEWSTGKRELIHFKEDMYKCVFNQHLKMLDYFHQQTSKMDILPKMLQ